MAPTLRADADDMDFNPATHAHLYHGTPFTGEMHEYATDGSVKRVKAISEFLDGYPHGMSRVFHPDGTLAFEGEYRRNRRVGAHRTWYANGRLQEEISYSDDGTWLSTRRWNEAGELTYTDTPAEGPSSLRP
jgi:antitoxin component YwqK of YwqJK toxin-antitoxin module